MPHVVPLARKMESLICAATLFEAGSAKCMGCMRRHKQREGCRCTLVITQLTNVDGDVSGVDASLQLAHLGMVPPPPEQPWRLHPEVAHLDQSHSHVVRVKVCELMLWNPLSVCAWSKSPCLKVWQCPSLLCGSALPDVLQRPYHLRTCDAHYP